MRALRIAGIVIGALATIVGAYRSGYKNGEGYGYFAGTLHGIGRANRIWTSYGKDGERL